MKKPDSNQFSITTPSILGQPARFRFRINLSADAYLRYYQGSAKAVIVKAEDGRRIQLPAGRLLPFLLEDGVHGRFEITLDENNKLIEIERLPG